MANSLLILFPFVHTPYFLCIFVSYIHLLCITIRGIIKQYSVLHDELYLDTIYFIFNLRRYTEFQNVCTILPGGTDGTLFNQQSLINTWYDVPGDQRQRG